MRLRNFVMEGQIITASPGDTVIEVDSTDPTSRTVQAHIYPFSGDINTNDLRVFQGVTQMSGSSHLNASLSGSMSVANIVNTNETMKMTASLSAPVEIHGEAYKWTVLMVANSVFTG